MHKNYFVMADEQVMTCVAGSYKMQMAGRRSICRENWPPPIIKLLYKLDTKQGGRVMKKRIMESILGMFMLAFLLSGCAQNHKLSEKFDEAQVKEAAEDVIEALNSGETDTLVEEKWNAVMKSALDAESIKSQILPIIEELGEFEEFDQEAVTGGKDSDTEQEFAIAVIKAKYEKRKAQFTISFDEDMKVGGFYIK